MTGVCGYACADCLEPCQSLCKQPGQMSCALKMPLLDMRLRCFFAVVCSKAFTWKEYSLVNPSKEVSEASALLSRLLPSLCPC